MQVLPKQRLRSLVQRLHTWTGSLLSRLADPTPSAPAQFDSNLQPDCPPAHWLERVRQGAPELLQPGPPVRVRPADAMPPIEDINWSENLDQTLNTQHQEAQTLDLGQREFFLANDPPRLDAAIATNAGSPVRLHKIATRASNPQVSYSSEPPSSGSVVHPELGSAVIPEQGTERSTTSVAEEFTFHHASLHQSSKNDSVHSAVDTTASRALRPPLRLKPLPLKLTAFSGSATDVASAASPDLEQAAVMSNQPGGLLRSSVASGSQSGGGQSAQSDPLRQSSAPHRISKSPSSGGDLGFDAKLESSVDAFTQRGGEVDRSAFANYFISKTSPVNFPEEGTANYSSGNSIHMAHPRWIDLPDRQNWNESEDKTWNFILGDRDHLQRLLREQKGDERAQG
jgi:hypothetical protein